MVLCTFFRNPYGELSKALGMTLIYAFQRFKAVRKKYPTVTHLKACVGMAQRRPFPDDTNPWSYVYDPQEENDIQFRMVYAIIAMGFIGSVCGGNIHVPMFPTWLGALVGAATLAFSTTLQTARVRGSVSTYLCMYRYIQHVWEKVDILVLTLFF